MENNNIIQKDSFEDKIRGIVRDEVKQIEKEKMKAKEEKENKEQFQNMRMSLKIMPLTNLLFLFLITGMHDLATGLSRTSINSFFLFLSFIIPILFFAGSFSFKRTENIKSLKIFFALNFIGMFCSVIFYCVSASGVL